MMLLMGRLMGLWIDTSYRHRPCSSSSKEEEEEEVDLLSIYNPSSPYRLALALALALAWCDCIQ